MPRSRWRRSRARRPARTRARLRRRIEGSDEARQWRLDHLATYRRARPWLREEADLVLGTAGLSIAQVARHIAGALPMREPR